MRKKYLFMTAALCLSMMLFAGCGNNDANDKTATEATASPDSAVDDLKDGAEDAADDVGEGAKDVIDGAEDAVDGAADGTKDVIDDVTDDDDTDNNNSVTSGKDS